MGLLTDTYDKISAQGNAAQLIKTLTDLKTQYQTLQTEIPALITSIKTNYFSNGGIEAANYPAVAPIFQELADKMFTYSALSQRKAQFKTQLQALKDLVGDVTYETEIQAEVDSI
jgi:hypothetical protein